MSFQAPDNYKEIYDEVLKKCYSFIDLNYWDKIERRHLDKWLGNFRTKEEKYLSALILNKIIYRNQKTIISSLTQLFHIILPDLLKKYELFKIDLNLAEWEEKLQTPEFKKETSFLFSEIKTDKLGSSSAFYMRLLRENFIHYNLLQSISEPKIEQVKSLIFIDDIIGSGIQASQFIIENNKEIAKYEKVFFIPLIAHEDGINKIKKTCSQLELNNIIIHPIELLNDNNSFFKFEEELFDGKNTILDLKEFYKKVVNENSIIDNPHFLYGLGDLELLLLFSTGVPDNTLPLIHTNKAGEWYSLQKRF